MVCLNPFKQADAVQVVQVQNVNNQPALIQKNILKLTGPIEAITDFVKDLKQTVEDVSNFKFRILLPRKVGTNILDQIKDILHTKFQVDKQKVAQVESDFSNDWSLELFS